MQRVRAKEFSFSVGKKKRKKVNTYIHKRQNAHIGNKERRKCKGWRETNDIMRRGRYNDAKNF